ncbi:MAG TPA: RagB/SusD family nutrient uptake outer membrane protein [Chryseolinea sp.]
MKKRILYGTIFSLFAVAWSCSDSFLDVKPKGVLSDASLANKAGVESQLVAAYSILDGWFNQGGIAWGTAGSNWIFGSVTSDDAYKGSELGDQGEIMQIELFQWDPQNVYFNNKFTTLYEGVARSNSTINILAKATDVSDADRSRIKGEALFLRAHYHFDAYKFWKNIPYFFETDDPTKVIKPNTDDAIPNIVKDLKDAIELLPETQADKGRITKGAAQAYLGKVYMFANDYTNAKVYLELVYNNPAYKLSSCFHDIFTMATENNSESLLSIQASVNDGSGGGENANHSDRLTYPHSGSPFGCCGFHQPSQNLVNAYRVDAATGLPLNDNSSNANPGPADFVDPRLDFTVGRNGVPFLDWGIHAQSWIRSPSYSGEYSGKKFIRLKGDPAQGSGWNTAHLTPLNIPILRLSDVYLYLAEVEARAGNYAKAQTIVNQIRTRAGGCAQGAGTATSPNITTNLNDPAITWAKYKVGIYTAPWADLTESLNAITLERRLELALEGHRFFDLRRLGIAKEVINAYIDVEKTRRDFFSTSTNAFQDRHMLYPIPGQQLELSKVGGVQILTQNTGF